MHCSPVTCSSHYIPCIMPPYLDIHASCPMHCSFQQCSLTFPLTSFPCAVSLTLYSLNHAPLHCSPCAMSHTWFPSTMFHVPLHCPLRRSLVPCPPQYIPCIMHPYIVPLVKFHTLYSLCHIPLQCSTMHYMSSHYVPHIDECSFPGPRQPQLTRISRGPLGTSLT